GDAASRVRINGIETCLHCRNSSSSREITVNSLAVWFPFIPGPFGDSTATLTLVLETYRAGSASSARTTAWGICTAYYTWIYLWRSYAIVQTRVAEREVEQRLGIPDI